MLRKKTITTMILGLLLATSVANATWTANLKVDEIVMLQDGSYNVRFDKRPEDTCRYWNFDFRVDNDKGKGFLKFLTIALITNQAVHIGYTPSSTPGTKEDSGCNVATMARITQVHLQRK